MNADSIRKKFDFVQLSKIGAYDTSRMISEIMEAEKHHEFLAKAARGWSSIPLRSVGGQEGRIGNLGGGVNNVSDPNAYQDTSVMACCPYIKETVESLGALVLKVRVMKLLHNKKIGTHVDQFLHEDIIRLHIPVITNEKVRFMVDGNDQNLKAGTLYWVKVDKPHRVVNKDPELDRIHLVFDVYVNDQVNSLFENALGKF